MERVLLSEGNIGEQHGGITSEMLSAYSIMILLLLLGTSVAFAYILEKANFKWVHETFLALVLGGFVGLIIRFVPGTEDIKSLLQFDANLFFFLLLPPIIFNSGYDLRKRDFFNNFAPIVSYAFFGTTIATFVTGFLFYAIALMGVGVTMGAVDSLVFGALISATDTVCVIAIFHALHVEARLFAIVFGESVLNDAVAIVLFETLRGFQTEAITGPSVLMGAVTFLVVFTGSFFIGVICGGFSALIFKHTRLCDFPTFESSVFVVIAYTSYLIAAATELSGIVSLLFCGITMAQYSTKNMSQAAIQTTKSMFSVLAFMADNFVFTYMGTTIFTRTDFTYRPAYIILCFFAVMIGRSVNIIPISAIVNLVAYKKPEMKVPFKYQIMLIWAGMRGAMAFALAAKTENSVFLTTTMVIVVLTVVLLGSSTSTLLNRLGIQVHVQYEDEEEAESSTNTSGQMHWFERLEKKYFKPFLTISNSHSLGVDGHHLLQQQPEEDRMEMTAIPTNEFIGSDAGPLPADDDSQTFH